MLAALANSDPAAAHAFVTDLLSIAGISTVGGRSVGEIADRFLEQSALGAATLPRETRTLIERFLSVTGDPPAAAKALRALTHDAGVPLEPALDAFEERSVLLAKRGLDLRAITFATAFGRGFDYYTGMVFELHDRAGRSDGQLVAGGRYDEAPPRCPGGGGSRPPSGAKAVSASGPLISVRREPPSPKLPPLPASWKRSGWNLAGSWSRTGRCASG